MPKLNKIKRSTEQKLDITKYFSDIMDENETAWITLRRLSGADARKLQLIISNTDQSHLSRVMRKYITSGEITLQEIQDFDKGELTDEKKIKIIELINEASESQERDERIKTNYNIMESVEARLKLVLNSGIHPEKHNFIDEKDEKIELNYEFWDDLGNEELLKYLETEIMNFSAGVRLGEKKGKKSA